MGFWKGLFKQSNSLEADHRTLGRFSTWVEPNVPQQGNEWQRRLSNYAKKCARELDSAGVAKWRSRFPRSGADAFQGAFWVVSVDVDAAERYFVTFNLGGGAVKSNDFGGFIRGDALILTGTGGLFDTKVEMWFPPSGDHDEGDLDSLFHNPSTGLLQHSPWAGLNVGKWRSLPDNKVYGATQSTTRSNFKSRYPPYAFSGKVPGKGSSVALNNFVRSGGLTQWPRHFDEYYGA